MRRWRLQTSAIWRRDVLSQPFSAIFASLAAHLKNDVHNGDTLLTYGRKYLGLVSDWVTTELKAKHCQQCVACRHFAIKVSQQRYLSLSVFNFPSHRHEKYVCFNNKKLELPLYHVDSGTMQYFYGTWLLRRAKGFFVSLHMRVWDLSVHRSTVRW